MQYFNGAITVAKSLLIAVGVAVLLSVNHVSAQDAGSRIEVMVCPDVDQSRFTVIAPQSDSVISDPKVILSGEVEYISQIDFFIDDAYNNTVALGYSETNFESTVTLAPGTHTIKFVATDSCFNRTHSDSLVVTYQPKVEPSVGNDVETVVDGHKMTVAEEEPVDADQTTLERIIEQIISTPLAIVGDSLDIVPSKTIDTFNAPAESVRSIAFISGATLTLTAIALHAGMLSMLPVKAIYLTRHRHGLTVGSAAVGVVLMAVVFML